MRVRLLNIRVSEAAGLIMKVSLTESSFPGLEEVELKRYSELKHDKSYNYRGIRVFLLSLFFFLIESVLELSDSLPIRR